MFIYCFFCYDNEISDDKSVGCELEWALLLNSRAVDVFQESLPMLSNTSESQHEYQCW